MSEETRTPEETNDETPPQGQAPDAPHDGEPTGAAPPEAAELADESPGDAGKQGSGGMRIRWGKVVHDDAPNEGGGPATDSGGAAPAPDKANRTAKETPAQRMAVERRVSERRRHTRLKVALGISIALSAVLVLDIVASMEPEGLETPPVSILGTWVTDDARYADRAFEMLENEIVLHVGDGVTTRHAIQSIERDALGDSWNYEIIYASPDGEQTLAFVVHPGGILRLKNPSEVIWRRNND
jgi:hypothetical protein